MHCKAAAMQDPGLITVGQSRSSTGALGAARLFRNAAPGIESATNLLESGTQIASTAESPQRM